MAGARVGRAAVRGDETGRVLGMQRTEMDSSLAQVAGQQVVEKMPPIGQEERPSVELRLARQELGERGRAAACLRNVIDLASGVGGEEDLPARAPGPASGHRGVAERLGCAPGGLDLLELSLRKEGQPAAVRRPERKGGPLCAVERTRFEGIEGAEPDRVGIL